jgi:hypothetical protein
MERGRKIYAKDNEKSGFFHSGRIGHSFVLDTHGIICGRGGFDYYCATRPARLRTTGLSCGGISLDTWLLGLGTGWLLLGARGMGRAARGWIAVDTWLLGVSRMACTCGTPDTGDRT